MWLIGLGVGAVLCLSGFLTGNQRLRLPLKILGTGVLILSLVYGALVICLLGGVS